MQKNLFIDSICVQKALHSNVVSIGKFEQHVVTKAILWKKLFAASYCKNVFENCYAPVLLQNQYAPVLLFGIDGTPQLVHENSIHNPEEKNGSKDGGSL